MNDVKNKIKSILLELFATPERDPIYALIDKKTDEILSTINQNTPQKETCTSCDLFRQKKLYVRIKIYRGSGGWGEWVMTEIAKQSILHCATCGKKLE